MRKRREILVCAVVATVATMGLTVGPTAPAMAQPGPPPPPPPPPRELPDLEGFSIIPFDFGPPGARSLAMGGTFIAIADDATASEANPAGLVNLTRPEVSLHARHSSYEIDVVDLNAAATLGALNAARQGSPLLPASSSGAGFAEPIRATYEDSPTSFSFASYVHPFESATVSLYYLSTARFRGSSSFEAYDETLLDAYETSQLMDVSLENFGGSLAFRVGERLAVGFSIRYSTMMLRGAQTTRADFLEDLELATLASGASLQSVRELGILDQRHSRQSYGDEDTDITFNAGLLINPGGKWSIGAAYKDGGSYAYRGIEETFSCLGVVSQGRGVCAPPLGREALVELGIKVPDFLGVGFAWRVTERFKIAVDAHHITYSDLTLDLALNPGSGSGAAPLVEPVDDEIELHAGVELISFVGAKQRPVTWRAGVLEESDHDGFVAIDSDEVVGTFGVGTVLMESLQIDLGARVGDSTQMGTLSMVYRF